MAHIGVMVGGLLPTFLVSRLVLWLMKSWPNGYDKLLAAHGVSVLVCGFLAGLGMADGGPFAGAQAAALYTVPQFVWLVVDLLRHHRREMLRQHQPVRRARQVRQPLRD